MSEPLAFYKDEQGYLSWLDSNPAGFVLNIDTQGRGQHRVHTARCTFLYPPNPEKRHTTFRQAVSHRLETLESWPGTVIRCSCLEND